MPEQLLSAHALPGIEVARLPDGLPGSGAPRFQVFFCQKGGLRLTASDGARFAVRPRQLLLLSDRARIRAMEPDALEGLLTAIEPNAAAPSLARIGQAVGGLALDLPGVSARLDPLGGIGLLAAHDWNEAVFGALDGMPSEYRGCYCVLKSVELLYLAGMGGICFCPAVSGSYRYPRAAAQKALRHIEEHIGEDLSIQALAGQLHISATALKGSFREHYGRPLHQLVVDCRMEAAARLLMETDLPVMQVAERVGYSSTSHFSAVFRERFYASPGEFRKRNKNV